MVSVYTASFSNAFEVKVRRIARFEDQASLNY
jgi:hypothetical protein